MPADYREIFPAHTVDRPNNMGLVRYVLSFAVLYDHFRLLSGWDSAPSLGISSYHAVGAFFALSGFLVFKSFLNSRGTGDYLRRRARRILPPYLTVVVFMALFCSVVSSLPPAEYFMSPDFWKYLGANVTFMNFLHPTLPGVFTDCVRPAVNGSLWTIKEEWALYLSVPVTAWAIWRFRWRPLAVVMALYGVSIIYRVYFDWLYQSTGRGIYEILSRQFVGQLMYFYSGVAIYFVYDRFRQRRLTLFLLSVAAVVCGRFIPGYSYVVEPMAIASLTLLASLCVPCVDFLRDRYNLAYEIYLFHFPVIQLAAHWHLAGHIGHAGTLAAVIAVTVIGAASAYRAIGRRFMVRAGG